MQSSNHRLGHRSLLTAACLLGALVVQTAIADCPPGYRSKAGHCIPGPAPTHHPWMKSTVHAPSAVPATHSKPHTLAPKMIDKSTVKPQPGAPIEQHASESNTHGIIFVGGKQALNTQPIPPGHSLSHLLPRG
ncbi:MAG: hypothetical protein JSS21_00205, partial [Proteobacteria bacterium]|nr:hypothetical protein [Pseudomonadota bacterium]